MSDEIYNKNKRKYSQDSSEDKQSEKKRKRKDVGGSIPRQHCPLSERQQLALVMQMTAEESNEKEGASPPTVRKAPGSSGRKDKVNKRNERGETPLHLATIRGDLPGIIDLIKQGADINVQDYAGWTPLHEACNHGYHHIAKYLLESGANVNSKGFENDYPLHDAVSNNHHDLVQLLLKHGANPLLPNKHGERPLDLSESEVITDLMKSEVLMSDESDDSSNHDNEVVTFLDREDRKWKERSGPGLKKTEKRNKQSSSSTASRELFKAEKDNDVKNIHSSSDSDDSDDVPLSRRKGVHNHTQKSMSSVNDVIPKLKHGSQSLSERKTFSVQTSDRFSRASNPHKPSLLKPDLSCFRGQDSGSSEEEIPLSVVAKNRKPSAVRAAFTITSSKTSDVYDFSPSADDFSSDSDVISLKPENRAKWEPSGSSVKKNLSHNKHSEKKTRKNSKDSEVKQKVSRKSPEKKTVLIRPALQSPKLQTSEILFDQLFKTPTKEETDAKTLKNFSAAADKSNISCTLPSSFTKTVNISIPDIRLSALRTTTPRQNAPPIVSSVQPSPPLTKTPVRPSDPPATITTPVRPSVLPIARSVQSSDPLTTTTYVRPSSSPTTTSSVQSSSAPVTTTTTSVQSCVPLTTTTSVPPITTTSVQSCVPLTTTTSVPPITTTSVQSCVPLTTTTSVPPITTTSVQPSGPPITTSVQSCVPLTTTTSVPPITTTSVQSCAPLTTTPYVQSSSLPTTTIPAQPTATQTLAQPTTPVEEKATGALVESRTASKETTENIKAVKGGEGKKLNEITADVKKQKQKSIDVDKIDERKTIAGHGSSSAVRSLSLDVLPEASPVIEKLKADNFVEGKVVRKVTQLELKEKVVKSASDPSKSVTKVKVQHAETKRLLPKAPAKTDVRQEPKKVSLLSDASSGFIGDLESASRQRHLEKQMMLKRKKLLQKRSKSNPGTKADERKAVKRGETPSSVVTVDTPATSKQDSSVDSSDNVQDTAVASNVAQKCSDVLDTSSHASQLPPPTTVLSNAVDAPPGGNPPSQLSVEHSEPVIDTPEAPQDDPLPTHPLAFQATPCEEQEMEEANDVKSDVKDDGEAPDKEELSESERALREYIRERLSLTTICFNNPERQKLPVYIPLSRLAQPSKNPTNVYEERAFLHKLTFEKRRRLTTVVPQAPQFYWEYMTFTGGYLLSGRKESHLSVPVLGPPPDLCDVMVELFNVHEEQRVQLRVQHAIEREKLIIACEQEIMRVHCRAARTIHNQQVPYSACAVLMDNEVYNIPRASNDVETERPSVRNRFNARMFISWLRDVDGKYDKMKSALLTRQKHEAGSMFSLQKTEWILKLKELNSQRSTMDVNEIHVPMVNISDDFDLLPA